MANAQYTISNTDRGDNSAFTVPGDAGGAGDDSFRVENEALDKSYDSYVHIENGWDVNADVQLRGTRFDDETMTAAAADGNPVTVSSGSNDFFDITSSHTYIDVQVTPASDPTSGNLVVTFQSREA